MGLLELRRRSGASEPVYPQMASTVVDAVRTLSSRGAAVAGRPGAGYPLLAETAKYASEVPPQQEFGQELDIVLRGLRGILHGEEAD
jgi:hypothetical protein